MARCGSLARHKHWRFQHARGISLSTPRELEARTCLYEVGQALPAVVKRLDDAAPTVRRAAAEVVGQCGGAAHGTVPRLLALQKDSDETVRRSATVALKRIVEENEP